MFLLAFVNTSGITISVNYLVDSFKELSGDAMASVMLVRNTMSFAIGYGYVPSSLGWLIFVEANGDRITPWVDNLGYQNCFISAAFIGMACSAVFLIMMKWGKTLREHGRERYWNIVVENWEKGMGH